MKNHKTRVAISFILPCLLNAGCFYDVHANSQPKHGSYSFNWSADVNSSGAKSSFSTDATTLVNSVAKRTSIRKTHDAERILEATGNVKFLKGRPVKWSPESLITLSESGFTQRVGELRPNGKRLQLFVKRHGKYEPANANDEQWAAQMLSLFNLDDTPESETRRELQHKCNEPKTLSSAQQKALIDDVFSKTNYASDQRNLLLSLIRRKDFTQDAKAYLINRLDKVNYQSDRKRIEHELLLKP